MGRVIRRAGLVSSRKRGQCDSQVGMARLGGGGDPRIVVSRSPIYDLLWVPKVSPPHQIHLYVFVIQEHAG